MDILSPTLLAGVARAAGFSGPSVFTATAVALAESGGRVHAANTAGNTPPSRDRGLWQINDHYHPEVTDEQAFNPVGCGLAAYRISSGGRQWTQWSTWNSGAALKLLPRAKTAGHDQHGLQVYVHGLIRRGTGGVIASTVRYVLGRTGRSGALDARDVELLREAQAATGLNPDGVIGPLTSARWGWVWVR